jgi:uncharacterized membrane protein
MINDIFWKAIKTHPWMVISQFIGIFCAICLWDTKNPKGDSGVIMMISFFVGVFMAIIFIDNLDDITERFISLIKFTKFEMFLATISLFGVLIGLIYLVPYLGALLALILPLDGLVLLCFALFYFHYRSAVDRKKFDVERDLEEKEYVTRHGWNAWLARSKKIHDIRTQLIREADEYSTTRSQDDFYTSKTGLASSSSHISSSFGMSASDIDIGNPYRHH